MKWSILGFVAIAIGCGVGGGPTIEETQSNLVYVMTSQPNGIYIPRPNPVAGANHPGSLTFTPTMCGVVAGGVQTGTPWEFHSPALPNGGIIQDRCGRPADRVGGAEYGYGTYVQLCFHDVSSTYLGLQGYNDWCEYFTIPTEGAYYEIDDLALGNHQNPTNGYPYNQWQLGAIYVGANRIRCHIYDQPNLLGNLVADVGWDSSHESTLLGDTNYWHTDYSDMRPYAAGLSHASMFCKRYAYNQ